MIDDEDFIGRRRRQRLSQREPDLPATDDDDPHD
jgi:hypothetical protein